MREPDMAFLLATNSASRGNEFWETADLVVEVVREDPASRRSDLETKPKEYDQAGITEYWIVEPQQQSIQVLTLKQSTYSLAGKYQSGHRLESVLLPGLEADIDAVWKAAAKELESGRWAE